jgi:putative flippase GtrA
MRQLIRYGLVGVVSNVAIYFVYLLITYLGIEPKIAMTLVYVVGATMGFVGNQKWTFGYLDDATKVVHRFVVVYVVAYVLNFLCMWVAVDRLGVPHYIVQAANMVVISALLFIAQKYWVFANSSTNKRQVVRY